MLFLLTKEKKNQQIKTWVLKKTTAYITYQFQQWEHIVQSSSEKSINQAIKAVSFFLFFSIENIQIRLAINGANLLYFFPYLLPEVKR